MSAVAAAVIGGVATIGGAILAHDAAGDAADAAASSAALQHDIAQQQVDLAEEQWNLYKNEVYPLELQAQQLGVDIMELDANLYKNYYAPLQQSIVDEAMEGIEAQPERVARDARIAIDEAFEAEQGMMQRDLERRGVRPGSGAYTSDVVDTSLNRAAAKGAAVNAAIEYEMDRVEDVNFNRKAAVLGMNQPVAGDAAAITPTAASAGLQAAGNTAYGAGTQYSSMASQEAAAAGQIVSGGIQLGTAAYDLYNSYAAPTYAYDQAQAQTGTSYAPGSDAEFAAFANGGPVSAPPMLNRGGAPQPGMPQRGVPQPGTLPGGQVSGPPGRDMVPARIQSPDGGQYPARLTDGEYVIPADVVRSVGTGPLDDIIEKARARKERASRPANALTRRRMN